MKINSILALPLLCGLLCMTAQAAKINEIRIDQPGTDNDEYVELKGSPLEDLSGLTYLVIGDGNVGSGVIEAVVDLNAQVLDANGLFVAAEASFTQASPDFITNLNFENSDNVTHMLVSGFSGTLGDDLDTDDDGDFDLTPFSEIVDSVSLKENDTGELLYSPTIVGPDGTFVPGHSFFCPSGWQIGTFAPVGTTDTPGQENDCSGAAPFARINEIRIDQQGTDNDEYFELKGVASASLDGLSYIVIGDGAGGSGTVESVTDLSGQNFTADGLFTVAETTFTLATANLTTNLNFENSDNVTHLLVMDFTGVNGDDLDANDDGTLETGLFSSIISSVALKENDTGELLYSENVVGPAGTFVPGHVFLCDEGYRIGEFNPLGTSDTPTAENDCSGGPVDPNVTERTIPEIQSSLEASPFDGDIIKTIGVVTADFQGADQLRGFYMQDANGDGDPATSDGIFVFTPSDNDVNVGDEVEVTAQVAEFFELTELTNVQSLSVLSSNNTLAPTSVTLPETVNGELERYEGMLIDIASPMTVSQNFFLGRFGQMTLSSPDDLGVAGRLFQPTNVFPAASQERIDAASDNARRILVLDDGQDISGFGDNPEPVPYIGNPPAVIRAGDTVTNLVGILDYGRISSGNTPTRDYRLQPTQAPIFTASNPRQDVPQTTNGTLSIASYNVLNYFSTVDGNGSICGPQADQNCRGADTESELARQQAKIVSALRAMDADVVGLIEIENNGYGPSSAISTLVDALNSAYAEPTYSFVTPAGLSNLGGDAIAVGFIYKPATVTPIGIAATLVSGAFDQTLTDGGRSRQPLAVSFEEAASGEIFTAVINHLKSKRPPSSPLNTADDDQGDGQGSWNLRRTQAANELSVWLSGNPTGIDDPDVLIIGDLNSYAEEDPMLALEAQGYTDVIQVFNGDTGYSFTFDALAGSLDQALTNESLTEQVTGVVEWHINTDEPSVIDYNEDFNPPGYYAENPFRSSDHDPVIVGLSLFSEPVFVDSDGDGIADETDECADTPVGVKVASNGCSAVQLVELKCEKFFDKYPRYYLRCVFVTVVKSLRQHLITRNEAKRIYYRAIIRAFFKRYYKHY